MSANKTKTVAAGKSRPVAQPKSMSSRLLTMKFMQRAAASNSSPNSPGGSPGHTKAETEILRAAAAAEVEKREAALRAHERFGGADAETRWELSYHKQVERPKGVEENGMKVVGVGYAELVGGGDDDDDDDDDIAEETGRMSFGGFRRKTEEKPKYQDPNKDEDGTASSSSESDEPASPTQQRKTKKKSSDATPAFISSAGAAAARAKKCYECGKQGHMKSECPTLSCHNCGKNGHRAVACPENSKNRGTKRKEKVLNLNGTEKKKKYKSER